MKNIKHLALLSLLSVSPVLGSEEVDTNSQTILSRFTKAQKSLEEVQKVLPALLSFYQRSNVSLQNITSEYDSSFRGEEIDNLNNFIFLRDYFYALEKAGSPREFEGILEDLKETMLRIEQSLDHNNRHISQDSLNQQQKSEENTYIKIQEILRKVDGSLNGIREEYNRITTEETNNDTSTSAVPTLEQLDLFNQRIDYLRRELEKTSIIAQSARSEVSEILLPSNTQYTQYIENKERLARLANEYETQWDNDFGNYQRYDFEKRKKVTLSKLNNRKNDIFRRHDEYLQQKDKVKDILANIQRDSKRVCRVSGAPTEFIQQIDDCITILNKSI